MSFGQRLNWLKTAFRVTDGEIGKAAPGSASLVCRWRSGQRALDRDTDADRLANLAGFFSERAERTDQTRLLARALSMDEADIEKEGEAYRSAFVDFLYAEGPVPDVGAAGTPAARPPAAGQPCYFGADGLLAALDLLERRMNGAPAEITVYLSLEYARVVREPSAGKLWAALRRMSGGRPVRLVFDNWTDADEAMKTLSGLLPFMQTGDLRLHLVKSAQKFFYSNVSFYAGGTGMVITAEPAGGLGNSVSMPVENPDYIKGMGEVFARLDKNTKPLERHMGTDGTKDEAVLRARLYEPGGDLRTVIDGANLLYLDADTYGELLKLNNVTGSQRAYRLERFESDKRRFGEFLESGRATEIFSLPAFDDMVRSREIKTPDFSFHAGAVKADGDVLKSLFTGMLDYLGRYENLSVYLNRRSLPDADFSCRLKGDGFVLLHAYENGAAHAVWSDTWLLVYEYIRRYDGLVRGEHLITARDAARAALRMRLESLGA